MLQRLLQAQRSLKYFAQLLVCGTVLRLNPDSEWGLFHLGNAYAEHGMPARAVPLWQRACLRPNPRPAAMRNLAIILLQLEKPGEAIDVFRRLLASVGDQPDIYALLGRAYQRARRPLDAIAAYERALTLQPDNDSLRLALGLLFERIHQPARAIDQYTRIVDPSIQPSAIQRLDALKRSRAHERSTPGGA